MTAAPAARGGGPTMAPLLRACARVALTLLGVSLLAFAVIHAMPADPATIVLVQRNIAVTPETIAALHAQWGLDRPVAAQYVHWLGRFLAGDWGISFQTDAPIVREFAARLPTSLTIGLGGIALGLAAAVPLGYAAAVRPGGLADRSSRLLAVFSQSFPAFWLGFLLIWVLAVELRVIRPFTGGAVEQLILPTAVVAFYQVGGFARMLRAGLVEAEAQRFFTAGLAKGLSRQAALRRHAGRYAAYSLLATLTPAFAWAVGGTAVVEVVFAAPGISQFLVESIAVRDYFVLQAYIVTMAVWMLALHLVVATLQAALDPRVRDPRVR